MGLGLRLGGVGSVWAVHAVHDSVGMHMHVVRASVGRGGARW